MLIKSSQIYSNKALVITLDKTNKKGVAKRLFISNKQLILLHTDYKVSLIKTTDGTITNLENNLFVDVKYLYTDSLEQWTWLGTNNGLKVYNANFELLNDKWHSSLDGLKCNTVTYWQNAIWVGTDNGLYRVDTKSFKSERVDGVNAWCNTAIVNLR